MIITELQKNTIHKRYCQTCGKTKDLIKASKSKLKNGNYVQRYMCNDCNTKRAQNYRATEKGKLRVRAAVYKSINKHKNKQNAREKLNHALKAGKVVKVKACSKCLEQKKLEAHHPYYNHPYLVLWLCRKCHAEIHRELKEEILLHG